MVKAISNIAGLHISDRWIGLLAFGIIYLIWGANFLAIRFAIESIPPFLMAGTRFFIAGFLIYIWITFKGERLPSLRDSLPSIKQGVWLNVLGTGGLVWSEQYIPSGLAAIVLTTVPIWMVFLEKEKWGENFRNLFIWFGLGLGVLGVVLLSDFNTLGYRSDSSELFYLALLVLVLGAICWAKGSLFSRSTGRNISLSMNLAIQMVTAGAFLHLIGIFLGEYNNFSIQVVTSESASALIFLIVFSSIVGYSAYLWLLKKYSPVLVGAYVYVHPLIAVFLGWLLADELITHKTLLSLTMILGAVFLIKYAHQQTSKQHYKHNIEIYDCKNLARGCPEGKR